MPLRDRRERLPHRTRTDFVRSLPARGSLARAAELRAPPAHGGSPQGHRSLGAPHRPRRRSLADGRRGSRPAGERARSRTRQAYCCRPREGSVARTRQCSPCVSAADRTKGLHRRADLLRQRRAAGARSRLVPTRLADAIAAQAASADRSWADGNGTGSGRSVGSRDEAGVSPRAALRPHRVALGRRPETFLAPLHGSTAFAAMTAGAGRDRPAAPPRPIGRSDSSSSPTRTPTSLP